MSLVTNVLVVIPLADWDSDAKHTLLQTDLSEVIAATHGTLRLNTDCDAAWGGTRAPEIEVAAGAFNYLPASDFLGWVAGLPWRAPARLQVLIQGQNEPTLTLLTGRAAVLAEADTLSPDDV